MRTQEEFIGLDLMVPKTILLPLVSKWEELVDYYTVSLDKGQRDAIPPQVFAVPSQGRRQDVCTLGPYMRTEYADGVQTVNGHTFTRYSAGPTVYVHLHDDIARQIFESTIGIDDRMTYQLIQWDERKALFICQHSSIIGSRWVAVIDPSTIPADVKG